MQEPKIYKISLLNNFRFMMFLFILVALFMINLTLYQLLKLQDSRWNILFIVVSIVLIVVICYSIFKIQAVRWIRLSLNDDCIEYRRSQYENEVIEYTNIKYIGFYKKNIDDEEKFGFFDGLYIYDGSTDKYCFVGISFNDYREIFETIKSRCAKSNVIWHNIKRDKTTLLEELRILVGS